MRAGLLTFFFAGWATLALAAEPAREVAPTGTLASPFWAATQRREKWMALAVR
jgi:hypothetical protein